LTRSFDAVPANEFDVIALPHIWVLAEWSRFSEYLPLAKSRDYASVTKRCGKRMLA